MKVEMDLYDGLEEAEEATNEKLVGKTNARVYVKFQGDKVLVVITYAIWGRS
jgi:hypothetical protein